MIELSANALHFLGDTEQERCADYCVHGTVVFRVNGVTLSDETDIWCVSASAYRFLETLYGDHFSGAEAHMIPCCGHFFVPKESGIGVEIVGCPNGIDFDVIRHTDVVEIRSEMGVSTTVPFSEYKGAVLSYAERVEAFYRKNPPRNIQDPYDKSGFSAFTEAWYSMKDHAKNAQCDTMELSFDDYDVCTDRDITGITKNGISLNGMRFLNFRECTYRTVQICGGDETCVAVRDRSGSAPSLTFLSAPRAVEILFPKEAGIRALSAENTPEARMKAMEAQLYRFGYTVSDAPWL